VGCLSRSFRVTGTISFCPLLIFSSRSSFLSRSSFCPLFLMPHSYVHSFFFPFPYACYAHSSSCPLFYFFIPTLLFSLCALLFFPLALPFSLALPYAHSYDHSFFFPVCPLFLMPTLMPTLPFFPSHADVRFELDDGTRLVGGHRSMLCCASKEFKAMFQKGMKEEEEGVVRMRGVGACAVKGLLEWAYLGERCGGCVYSSGATYIVQIICICLHHPLFKTFVKIVADGRVHAPPATGLT
jgi:hypothetical protein